MVGTQSWKAYLLLQTSKPFVLKMKKTNLITETDCEECEDINYGDCPVHGPLTIVEDLHCSPEDIMCAAKASLPKCLVIKTSHIPNAGLGVFSNSYIQKGVRFGPYIGKKVKMEDVEDETNTSYMWEVN